MTWTSCWACWHPSRRHMRQRAPVPERQPLLRPGPRAPLLAPAPAGCRARSQQACGEWGTRQPPRQQGVAARMVTWMRCWAGGRGALQHVLARQRPACHHKPRRRAAAAAGRQRRAWTTGWTTSDGRAHGCYNAVASACPRSGNGLQARMRVRPGGGVSPTPAAQRAPNINTQKAPRARAMRLLMLFSTACTTGSDALPPTCSTREPTPPAI